MARAILGPHYDKYSQVLTAEDEAVLNQLQAKYKASLESAAATPAETVVDPWSVVGAVDYVKLTRDFGSVLISDALMDRCDTFARPSLSFSSTTASPPQMAAHHGPRKAHAPLAPSRHILFAPRFVRSLPLHLARRLILNPTFAGTKFSTASSAGGRSTCTQAAALPASRFTWVISCHFSSLNGFKCVAQGARRLRCCLTLILPRMSSTCPW